MPSITYFVKFHLKDGTSELQEYTGLMEAWEVFRQFAEPDSLELYDRLGLFARNWENGNETPIAKMSFF